MYKAFRNHANRVGQVPGALLYIGEKKIDKTVIQRIDYDDQAHFVEQQIDDLTSLTAVTETTTTTWINIIGLHEVDKIAHIGEAFHIHPLLLEDILNTGQRPKMEHDDQYIYLILKRLNWNEQTKHIEIEQVSIVLGDTFVLSFQEQDKNIFQPIRQRIYSGKGRIRKAGADYLAYTLLDLIVDHYFLILEQLGDKVEALEDELIDEPTTNTLQIIHELKREMLLLRKSIWPLRELLSGLQRGDSELFQQTTLIYLRDVYEHTIQIIDNVETLRDIVSSMLDIYLSVASNKMNEVMKVLTVIATIFIPLTFITSLYGMNFHYMPELQWHWGYPLIWLLILLIAVMMLLYFKRKKWL